MRMIDAPELGQVNRPEACVLDIRTPEEFAQGTAGNGIPAVNIPWKLFEESGGGVLPVWTSQLDNNRVYYVMCPSGAKARLAARMLEEQGFSAVWVQGGWRRWLAGMLEKEAEDENIPERTLQIEKSIIKKFRRPVWRQFTKAVHDYQLIQEGDRIACCISGGKDSMLLAKLLQELQKHGKVHFDLEFLCMNPGYHEENWSIVQNNARILGIPLAHFDSQVFDIVADIVKSPCYLCARMRRGYLYSRAKALGCNKIALGHHFDDVIETVLMGMFFAGKFETMMPKLHSNNFPGMELIRPMYLVKERDVKAWRDYNHLHFIQCACRFTEQMEKGGEESGSRREDMKQLINTLRKMDPNVDKNIMSSTHDVSLKTILGFHTDTWRYSFLDDYDLPEEQRRKELRQPAAEDGTCSKDITEQA